MPQKPAVLAVDVGGSHVKALLSGESERRRFDSGSDLTPQTMVEGVLRLAEGWQFDRVSVGIPAPVRGGKQPRILFATQASARPPRFVLFTTGFLEAGYRRFVERRLRETFGFTGTPIGISVRPREKRRRWA